ncbi:M16 family metallopeptidase [Pedobacter chitinilyticus]|uniref:Insulinase family protein n=1 Tax=Pedobacter chitinilyticus TaxID=2233776 RepID=A0A3S3PP23_9SPHI|nr:pitrilysin family protein [Pedobacter chitinilyticus]RWU08235.1 insulinase family protein [Pedobacter chitinilyticus]
MLNRTVAPAFNQVSDINFIQPISKPLANGLPVYILNAGEQELVRIEFIFENANWSEQKPLQAVAVNGLINSGTSTLTAKQIADGVDYYGAFLQTEYSADFTTITLYTLTKHLSSVLPILLSVLNESIFPQHELEIYQQNQKQKLQVSLQKNDYLARKTFAHAIFGDTAYGSDINPSDYDQLQQTDLLAYFKAAYQPKNCTIIIAGKFVDKDFEVLDTVFGGAWQNSESFDRNHFSFSVKAGEDIYIEKPEALQSAIRMGNLSINRTHVDFPALQVLNCVFGGYFGSRLMANIREDKGYTYGIGSGIASLKHAGYFFLATEVGANVCADALKEIEKEITLLREDLVADEELDLVKNYMLGSMLGSLENAFSHADKFKNIHFFGLDYSYYSNYVETVKNITAQDLKEMANKYLDWNAMARVVVGKK